MDDAARNELIESVVPWCHALATRYVPRVQDRDDATQTLFLRLLRGAPSFDPAKGKISTWTAAVAIRLFAHGDRKRDQPTVPLPARIADDRQHRAEDAADNAEQVVRLREVMALLPPADAAMLTRVVVEGEPVANLDRSQSRERCRQKFNRALARARRLLESPAPLPVEVPHEGSTVRS